MTQNKKRPSDGKSEETHKIYYGPFTSAQKNLLGGGFITSADPEAVDQAIDIKFTPQGSYTSTQADSQEKENVLDLNVGNIYRYISDGYSRHNDGHSDFNTQSTIRKNCMGDIGESGQKGFCVFTQGLVSSVCEGKVDIVCAESESWTGQGTYGDQVNEHSGNWHEAFEKDRVTAVKKNDVLMIGDGDYACHVQSGNWDTHIKSKARMYADNDILIESATKIVLKVGSSTITITPSNIEILASGGSGRIDLNK